MFDATLRPLIDPPLRTLAARLDACGASPNGLTLGGLFIGLLAVPALSMGNYALALVFIAINRLLDGLDGTLARLWAARAKPNAPNGGFLAISADFVFYGAIPFGFALANPEANALFAAFLLFAFIATGTSFLAFAIVAEQRGLSTHARGKKGFYYLGGLAEGTETIAAFVLACLLPTWFPQIALFYGALCWITVIVRFFEVRTLLKDL